jgi:DNA adenine methylase
MGIVKTVFRYPGGKSKLLPKIWDHLEPLLDNDNPYIEPFVGGGSIMLYVASKYPQKTIFINDKNYGISSFWSIVTGEDQSKINKLLSLIDQKPTINLHKDLRKDNSEEDVFCAYKALFFNRCNFSGIESSGPIGGEAQKGKYKIDCRYNPSKLKDRINEINSICRGRVFSSNLDINDYHLFWENDYAAYIDPPYLIKGKELYNHFMTTDDHESFSTRLKNRKNWILSYDDNEKIRELYKDIEIVDLNARYSINGKKTEWSVKNELIIKNI